MHSVWRELCLNEWVIAINQVRLKQIIDFLLKKTMYGRNLKSSVLNLSFLVSLLVFMVAKVRNGSSQDLKFRLTHEQSCLIYIIRTRDEVNCILYAGNDHYHGHEDYLTANRLPCSIS